MAEELKFIIDIAVKGASKATGAIKSFASAAKNSLKSIKGTSLKKVGVTAKSVFKGIASSAKAVGRSIVNSFKSAASGAKRALGGIKTLAGKAFRGVRNVAAVAIAGILASLNEFGKREMDVVAFEAFLGSAEEAEKAVKMLEKLSVKSPFTPNEMRAAGLALGNIVTDVDDLSDKMGILSDVMAQFKAKKLPVDIAKDFANMSAAFRSGEDFGESLKIFQDLGAILPETKVKIKQMYDEFRKGKKSINPSKEALQLVLKDFKRFEGAADKMANTIAGKVSTTIGLFQLGAVKFASGLAGLADNELSTFNEALTKLVESGDLEKWGAAVAKSFKDAKEYLAPMITAIKELLSNIGIKDGKLTLDVEGFKEDLKPIKDIGVKWANDAFQAMKPYMKEIGKLLAEAFMLALMKLPFKAGQKISEELWGSPAKDLVRSRTPFDKRGKDETDKEFQKRLAQYYKDINMSTEEFAAKQIKIMKDLTKPRTLDPKVVRRATNVTAPVVPPTVMPAVNSGEDPFNLQSTELLDLLKEGNKNTKTTSKNLTAEN